ncbi:unnamed protein product [Brassicogethes aeneus]|uniref:L-2-hydroxyglutarate dehydrogenase, mitochondrial n=1 Tax=Brassicogethes aeneus TaxID=1431903 RepID=A0A9P0BC93_BRAAE|nr:unnamed protein product [Brassicogethes aeneus]
MLKNKSNDLFDVLVIGGGIIGTAISRQILQISPNLKIAILEKEDSVGSHQTSHNSGVVHSGIYYKPKSLKAKLCVEGSKMIMDYARDKNIGYNKCGKILLANSRCEIRNLERIFKRGLENDVAGLKIIRNKEKINKIQPNSVGVFGLWCPVTANLNWGEITCSFLEDFRSCGGEIYYNFKVKNIKHSDDLNHPVEISSKNSLLKSKYLICCPGLQSEKIAELIGAPNEARNVSFRVQYMLLEEKASHNILTNIYEVPDIDDSFLGVHISPRSDGRVLLGPSALPALKTEGYRSYQMNLSYIKNTLSYAGFQKMTLKNLPKCINQVAKTICPEIQYKELLKLIDSIKFEDIEAGPTAVQTQLIDSDGKFVDDFVFEFFEGEGLRRRIINCRFLPSPAATSSLAIGRLTLVIFLIFYTLAGRKCDVDHVGPKKYMVWPCYRKYKDEIYNFPIKKNDVWVVTLGRSVWPTFFDHCLEAWNIRNQENILFLFYDDIVKDMRSTILKVCKFLGKSYTDAEIDRLVEHMKIDNFKKNESVNRDYFDFRPQSDSDRNFVRKGKVGSHKELFSKELNERANNWIRENYKKTDMRFPTMLE